MATIYCPACQNTIIVSPRDIDKETMPVPFPHITCPCCGNWIAVF